jgi:hypothetical protein
MSVEGMAAEVPRYPVRFDVVHAEKLSRLSTFFRLVLAIPLIIFVVLLGGSFSLGLMPGTGVSFGLVALIFIVHVITVLVRGRPVRWVFDTMVAIQRFILRAYAYLLLVVDKYPPFDGDWVAQFEVDFPTRIRRRQLVLWKLLLSIPHLVALLVLSFLVAVIVFIGWFAILFTGQFPRGLHDFVVGWLRWYARASAYWFSLTDDYPPFSLAADVGPARRLTFVLCSLLGIGIAALGAAGIVALVRMPVDTSQTAVAYEDLREGHRSPELSAGGKTLTLNQVSDPYELPYDVLTPDAGNRFVMIGMTLRTTYRDIVYGTNFRLVDSEGTSRGPLLLTVDGERMPVTIRGDHPAHVVAIFEVPVEVEPAELRYSAAFKKRIAFLLE